MTLGQHIRDSVLQLVEPSKQIVVSGFEIEQYLKLTKRRIHAEDSLGVEWTSGRALPIPEIGKRACRAPGFQIDTRV